MPEILVRTSRNALIVSPFFGSIVRTSVDARWLSGGRSLGLTLGAEFPDSNAICFGVNF